MRRGFTLIELSIVLVIIGLVVGGILVGAELIRSAEIRAFVGQVEKYQTSFHAFRLKYGALPGDMPAVRAARFGFFQFNPGGDGDERMIYFCDGEGLVAWRHLSEANMIDGEYGVRGNSAITAAGQVTGTVTYYEQSFPPAAIGGNYFQVGYWISSGPPRNYFQISGLSQVDPGVGCIPEWAMSPIVAQQIDGKMDDGAPMTGGVWGLGSGGMVPTPGFCLVSPLSGGIFYNTQVDAGGEQPACFLLARL
jgi:prepilin-type N-terminal cleavage/methylation domain-containing protein